jgi:hypothetical protein
MDWSAEHGKEWQGDLDYYISQAAQGLPGAGIIPGPSATDVINLHDQGYNGYTGGRAVWEQMQSDNPVLVRGAMDALNPTDPINAVGYAAGVGPIREGIQNVGRIGESIRGGNAFLGLGGETLSPTSRLIGAGIEGLGKGAYGAVRASELPGELFFRYAVGKPIGFAARNTFGRAGLLDRIPVAEAKNQIAQFRVAVNELMSNTMNGGNRMQPFTQPIDQEAYRYVSPFQASPRMRGSTLAQQSESMADRAWSALKSRFGSGDQRLGFAAGAGDAAAGGIPIPQAPQGFVVGQLPTFTNEDLDNFAQLFASHIVGRMNETPEGQQLGAMLDVMHRGTGLLSEASGYSPQSLDPLMPEIFNRTGKFGVDTSINARYARESGFAEGGSSILSQRNTRGNPQFANTDVRSGPTGSPKIGDEFSAMATGHILGGRQSVDPTSIGTGYGFAPGEDYFNPGRSVEIKTKPSKIKKAEGIPDQFRSLQNKSKATVVADARDLQILTDLQSRGLLNFTVKDGGGFVAPASYEHLLDDADAVGAGGLTFRGPNGTSIKDYFEQSMRAEFGNVWDKADPAFKAEVWRRGVQTSYGMFVQAAQESYLPVNKLADLYWKNLDAGESVDNLAIRYTGAIKRQIKRANVKDTKEATDQEMEDALDAVDGYIAGKGNTDPVMDQEAKQALGADKFDTSTEKGAMRLDQKGKALISEQSKGNAFASGRSAGGYDPNSMAAQFEAQQGQSFSNDALLRRNTHGQAMPQDVPMIGPVEGERPTTKLRRNPTGTYPINFSSLMHAIQTGAKLNMADGLVRDWYARGVAEMANLFGLGAMDDVYAFSLLTAATSAQEGPERNLESALRLWVVSLIGNDPELLRAAGVKNSQGIRLNDLLNDLLATARGDVIGGTLGRDADLDRLADDLATHVGKKLKAGDRPGLGNFTNAHTNTSAQALAEIVGEKGIKPLGGAKFGDYKQSFIDDSVRQAIKRGYGEDTDLGRSILDAWDNSQSQFTIDRHQNQLNGFNAVVHPYHYRVGRYMGRKVTDMVNEDAQMLEALGISKLQPEAAQAATWYYAKGAKGFSTSARYNDDIGAALVRRLKAMGRTFDQAPRDTKIAMIQSLIKDVTTDGHLVSPGRVTPQRIENAMPEIMRNVDKMSAQVPKALEQAAGDPKSFFVAPISFAYRFADPAIYKETAGKSGIEALNIVRGQTVAVGGTPIIPWGTPREEAEATIRQTLNSYRSALDGQHGDALKLGFYGTPDGYSVDINVVVGDENLAREIAQGNNQIAYYNNTTGDEVATGGTGEPTIKNGDELNQFLDTFMSQRMGERFQKDLNGEGGAVDQLNQFRNNSLPPELENLLHLTTMRLGYMRAKLQPFFDLYQASGVRASMADATEQGKSAVRAIRMKDLKGLSRKMANEITVANAPARNTMISQQANKTLYENGFTKGPFEGKTLGDTFNSLYHTVKDFQDKMAATGAKWVPDADLKTKQQLAQRIPNSKETLKMLDGYGLDALADKPEKIAAEVVEREIEKEFGVQHEKMTGMQMFRAAWGEQALLTPRYHLGNLVGGWMQNVLAGRSINVDPVDMAKNIRLATGKPGSENWGMAGTKWMETLEKWGFGGDVPDINRINGADTGIVAQATTRSSVGKIASKVVGQKVGNIIGKPFEVNKQIAGGVEMSLRGSLVTEVLDNEMQQRVKVLAGMAAEAFDKEGIDATSLSTDIFQGSAKQVKLRLKSTGLSEGKAESLTRTYVNFKRTALDKGIAESKRIQFSYDYTKLDDAISKVIPFHYWASRALKFYGEETLRHPVWLYNYVKLQDGMNRMMEDPGTSARQKGFLRLMSGPTGFSLLMNPDSLVGVIKAVRMDSTYEPDGQTSLGGLINRARQHGVGLFPWIDATMNYLGAYGDTYAPDPLGLRHRALAGAAINEIRAYTGMDPATAPYEAFNTKLREFISTTFDAATPDWMGKPVAVKASTDGTMQTATQDDLIATRILADNPGITNQEMVDILNNPDDPRFDKAYREVADAGLLNQLLNITIPVNTKVREDSRDVSTAQMKSIRAAAKEAGVPPSDYVPTPADVQFYESYKKLTGKDFQPGDFDKAAMKRDLATSTPQARTFTVQKYEYDSIGSPSAKAIQDRVTQIANGEWFPTGVTPGVYDENIRWQIAQDWAKNQPGYQDYLVMRQAKNMYQDSHPEFAEYDNWRGSMYNVVSAYGPEGLAYYRQRVSETNANAKAYFDRRIQYILQNNRSASAADITKMLDGATISPDTWFAVSGRAMSQYDQQPQQSSTGAYYDPVQQPGNVLSDPPQQPQLPSAPSTWMEALQSFGSR